MTRKGEKNTAPNSVQGPQKSSAYRRLSFVVRSPPADAGTAPLVRSPGCASIVNLLSSATYPKFPSLYAGFTRYAFLPLPFHFRFSNMPTHRSFLARHLASASHFPTSTWALSQRSHPLRFLARHHLLCQALPLLGLLPLVSLLPLLPLHRKRQHSAEFKEYRI